MRTYLIIGLGIIVGWNVFLIQRDAQLFKSYNQLNQNHGQ